jgi:hypothetical protein
MSNFAVVIQLTSFPLTEGNDSSLLNVILTVYVMLCHMVQCGRILTHFKLVFGVRFEVLMVMTIQSVGFCDVTSCSLVHGYRYLEESTAFIFRTH